MSPGCVGTPWRSRGAPFGDLADEEFVRPEAIRLEELRATAIDIYFEAEFQQEHYDRMIGKLEAEVEVRPFQEHLWSLLVASLAREGRSVEALRAYERAGKLLRESGVAPCAELRRQRQQLAAGSLG